MKVALTVIVKASDNSEAKGLFNLLNHTKPYVDEIFIQLNAPKDVNISKAMRKVAEKFTDKIFVFEWAGNFVNARNALMEKVPAKYDWIVWADTDDLIENPEMIKPSLAVMPDDVHGVFILYNYQKDDFGNVIVAHWNTRAIRNNGVYSWKSSFDDGEVSVHETLIAKRGVRQVANNEWKVVHQATTEHLRDSLVRNIELLEGMALRQSKTPKGIDPRILFYLGSHNYDAYNYKDAEKFFIEYLDRSGWGEERAEAHIYLGKILLMHDKEKLAKNAFLMSIGEYADNPGAYLGVGKIEAKNERWVQAAAWFRRGLDIKRELTSMVRYNYDWELYSSYANALSQLGGKNLSEALKMAGKAYKLRPYDPISKENRDNILNLIDYRDNLRAVTRLIRKLEADNESDKILPFVNQLPSSLEESPVVVDAKHQYLKSITWPDKSIAIYVGQGPLGMWGPWSLEEGGIGGSEEAVIRLSQELTKLGWQVTVYGMPGKRAGDYDGVEWKQYWEINNKDTFDVLISWRQVQFFDFKWKARKTYLWLHDVMEKDELTPERLENITKIIYVSEYHSEREESSNVPKEKKFPSGNGINPDEFKKYDGKIKRDPYKIIYMSANERGLRILYDIWEDVKKAVPKASLVTYYGWQSFDAINNDNPERMAWKATMRMKAKELGIPDSKRISHAEINKEIFSSGIFAYPCIFPEVNCITVQKAQAGGAIPVTSDFAVLPDVVLNGETVPMHDFQQEDIDRYKERLIWWLKHPKEQENIRAKTMKEARETFDWRNTAKGWDNEFNGRKEK